MIKNNLTKILKGHTHGWVSVSKDYGSIIASGRNLKDLLQKLQKMGNPDGFLLKAAGDYSQYTGT